MQPFLFNNDALTLTWMVAHSSHSNRELVSKDYVWLTINQVTEPLLGGNAGLKPMDLNGLFMFDNLLKLTDYEPYETFLDKWAALDPEE